MNTTQERLEKPRLGWKTLWNISFGFFGIQLAVPAALSLFVLQIDRYTEFCEAL